MKHHGDKDKEKLEWLDDKGKVVRDYDAKSGPWGNGPLESGPYTILLDTLQERSEAGFSCSQFGWSVEIIPNFQTTRELLRIHPDGNVPGTRGCIGVQCSRDAADLLIDLSIYNWQGHKTMDLVVED